MPDDLTLRQRPPPPSTGHPVSVTLVRDADGLAGHAAALDDLAGNAEAPNPYYEPWFALPLLRAFGAAQDLLFLLLSTTGPDGQPRQIGFFPFERTRLHRFAPLPCLRLWRDPYLYVPRCDPLVRAGAEDACAAALLDWVEHAPDSPGLLDLPRLTADTPFTHALERRLAAARTLRHARLTQESHLYRRQSDADTYLKTALSGERRQTLRRKRRHLDKLGPVTFTDVEDGDGDGNVDAAIDGLIDLEASGWKGAEGTAIATLGHRAVIRDVLRAAHARGRLSLLALRVDGRLVAARSAFLAPPGSFVFKIGHDEREPYARSSPGFLLEEEAIRRLHATDGLAWQDTCSAPSSTLFRAMRSDPLPLARHLLAARGSPAAALLALLPALLPHARRIRRALRRARP
ncbi:GNAT family N-acetyltransferase [Azospirillum sp.]|uniref:GNAT family N-acetyltransferase n=1 Tax=Azospirillum sp. TaxID=34012 RepID=UPI002D63ADC8|nr:GNAT family N-acetyltransferase [Azospirillum sp.]HYD71323.1 GNAT family N-acetyltransferase [Azospirillum sp.]